MAIRTNHNPKACAELLQQVSGASHSNREPIQLKGRISKTQNVSHYPIFRVWIPDISARTSWTCWNAAQALTNWNINICYYYSCLYCIISKYMGQVEKRARAEKQQPMAWGVAGEKDELLMQCVVFLHFSTKKEAVGGLERRWQIWGYMYLLAFQSYYLEPCDRWTLKMTAVGRRQVGQAACYFVCHLDDTSKGLCINTAV